MFVPAPERSQDARASDGDLLQLGEPGFPELSCSDVPQYAGLRSYGGLLPNELLRPTRLLRLYELCIFVQYELGFMGMVARLFSKSPFLARQAFQREPLE
jgi:hypothetical protein